MQQINQSTIAVSASNTNDTPSLASTLVQVFDKVRQPWMAGIEPVPMKLVASATNARWKELADRQGFKQKGSHRLLGVAKVYAVSQDQSYIHLFVVAPYFAPNRDYFAGRIGFEISIAHHDIELSPGQQQVEIGDLVVFSPVQLSNHCEPRPGFLTDTLKVLPRGLRYNPFAFANLSQFGHLVMDGQGNQTIAFARLINLLSFFYEVLDASDQQLVFDLMIEMDLLHAFLTQPASTQYHHCFKHGLAVHVVETVLHAVLLFNEHQKTPSIESFRLMILMALLHDIGKCSEYLSYGVNAFQLSLSGCYVGHGVMGAIWFSLALANQPDFCQLKQMRLLNCITGVSKDCYQSGNRTRSTFEAMLVHQADRMSASGQLHSDVTYLMRSKKEPQDLSHNQSLRNSTQPREQSE